MAAASLLALASASSAALVASYDFNGDLTDTLGNGADLVASGGSVAGGRYSFEKNQGLRLTSALPSTTDYAIEIKLSVDDELLGWNKLIDFQDLTSDAGLYVLNDSIYFYPLVGGGSVSLGSDFTVGLSRSGGMVEVFLNGVSIVPPFSDSSLGVPGGNILNFFEDDFATGQGEAFAGSVDFIRIHDDASTFGQSPGNRVPEPGSTWMLLGLGVLGCSVLRGQWKPALVRRS